MSDAHETNHEAHACHGPGYASPEDAMKAEREKVLYTVALYVGTDVEEPDYLATVDVDPESSTYSQVIERTPCRTSETSYTTSAGTPAALATATRANRGASWWFRGSVRAASTS
jgi:hypothetical protein